MRSDIRVRVIGYPPIGFCVLLACTADPDSKVPGTHPDPGEEEGNRNALDSFMSAASRLATKQLTNGPVPDIGPPVCHERVERRTDEFLGAINFYTTYFAFGATGEEREFNAECLRSHFDLHDEQCNTALLLEMRVHAFLMALDEALGDQTRPV